MSASDMNKPTKTNLERFDAMTDDMIDTSEIPPLTEEFFTTAKWRMPKPKVKVTVEIEPEVLEWFRAQGENYQRYLAAALRIYAQAHQAFKK
ncbi:MAG: BrnA antitoxin family protein [Chloroflexota bacterium]